MITIKDVTRHISEKKLGIIDYLTVYPIMFKGLASIINEGIKFQEDIAYLSKVSGLNEEEVEKKIRSLPYSSSYVREYFDSNKKLP